MHAVQPLWTPSLQDILKTRLFEFMKRVESDENIKFSNTFSNTTTETSAQSLTEEFFAFRTWAAMPQNTETFWRHVWEQCGVIGDHPKDWVIEHKEDIERAKFFPTGRLNFAENLLRRRDDATGIHFFAEDKLEETHTYKEIYDRTSSLQQFLKSITILSNDRLGCYLPNMPETIFGMLAASSLGAIWSTCSPDFGIPALVDRFSQITPRVLFMTDGYFYQGKTFNDLDKLEEICTRIPSIEHIVVIPFVEKDVQKLHLPTHIDHVEIHTLQDIYKKFPPQEMTFERFEFNHPLYILFSSGTTGIPKCIVHGAGGTLLQHMKEHQLHSDIRENYPVFYFTTCSWMMWHWLASILASGAKIILYDGSPTYPRIDYLFEIAEKTKLKIFGTSAKYLDNLLKHCVDIKGTYDLSSLKMIASTGSPLLPSTYDYVYKHIKKNVCLASISGGTDIVSCFVLGSPTLPVYEGEIQTSGLGLSVDVFDETGKSAHDEVQGELVCTAPFPAQPLGFWNDEGGEKYHNAYFATYKNTWHHGDFISKTPHGGFIIHGRSDAVLNPGGVRIGTAEIYRQVEALDFIEESLCIGQPVEGDERIILFVRLRTGNMLDVEMIQTIKAHIRKNTTPRHVPAKIIQISDIPRTKNNKIAELAVKQVVMGKEVMNTGSLLNPDALNLFKDLEELRV